MPLHVPAVTRPMASISLLALLLTSVALPFNTPAYAEKYQSRLNSLLLRKNDVYLPSRLVLGQEARFVVKAAPGSLVKLFVSGKGEGMMLNDETPLRVGADAQVLSGTVPESGVLELKMAVPKDPEMDGQVVYVDAVSGASETELKPIDLMDSTGRRTEQNSLTMIKQVAENGPAVMPAMPGLSPQAFKQLTTMSNIYSGQGSADRKQLLDNGTINRDRTIDRNPFINRGVQQGIGN